MPVTKYTKAELHKLAEKHRRMTGKLPTLHSDPPVPVPEQPITKRNPSTTDLLWANKWNLVRHFIVDGGGAAIAAFTATKDVTVSGAAFVVGGVVGAARKGFDDLRRSGGKSDFLTTALNSVRKPITLTEGADVNPILTMLLGSLDTALVMLKNAMATSAEADKYMKALAWNVLYFQDELHAMAAKTETAYDDAFVTELIEAAATIWGDGS